MPRPRGTDQGDFREMRGVLRGGDAFRRVALVTQRGGLRALASACRDEAGEIALRRRELRHFA